jgi:hypothetical protein
VCKTEARNYHDVLLGFFAVSIDANVSGKHTVSIFGAEDGINKYSDKNRGFKWNLYFGVPSILF